MAFPAQLVSGEYSCPPCVPKQGLRRNNVANLAVAWALLAPFEAQQSSEMQRHPGTHASLQRRFTRDVPSQVAVMPLPGAFRNFVQSRERYIALAAGLGDRG